MSVIITGAASGIGKATAEIFARDPICGDARIFLVDRNDAGLAAVAESLRGHGADVATHVADLSAPEGCTAAIAAAADHFGTIRALVSNAGAIHSVPLLSLSAAQFDLMFAINTRATLLLAQAAHPHLKMSGGTIVATASTGADHPAIPLGAYSASKAALVMLIRQMAGEWGGDGIRCNCVSPGPTHTGMTAASYDDPAIRAARGEDIPMGRVGQPDDVARAIRFLAGPDSVHVSGVDLRVDGGLDAVLGVSRSSAANKV